MGKKKASLTNRDKQRIDTEKRLFNAAVKEFKRVGVWNAQIEKITAEAGVSTGTFYHYFQSRHSVLQRLQQQMVAEALERYLPDSELQRDLKDELLHWIEAVIVEKPLDDWKLEREVRADMVRAPQSGIDWSEHPAFAEITNRIEAGQEAGQYDSQIDAAMLTRLFNIALFGLICTAPESSEQQLMIMRQFIDIFVRGIAAEEPPKSESS